MEDPRSPPAPHYHFGAVGETSEMLEFCSEHAIVADVEVIAPSYIDEAFTRLGNGDVHYRFVIDMNESPA